MEFRTNFLFWSTIGIAWSLFNFFFFGVIAGVNNGIGGWSVNEMYLLLSIFTILDAFTWSFFYRNMQEYTDAIYSGRLNDILVKPIDAQFLLMTKENSYNNVFRFILGVGVLIWSLWQLQIMPSLLMIVLFLVTLSAGLLLMYSLWFALSTITFYVENLDNVNNIVPSLRRVWQVPKSVYTGAISVIVTVLLPVGLITSVPGEILIQRWSWVSVGYLCIFSLAVFGMSRWFFKLSIRRYTGIAN